MVNLSPKKRRVNNKIPEIQRFQLLLDVLNIKTVDISRKSSLSERTINNFIWNNEPLSGHLLRDLYLFYNVSIDWLVSGKGEMLLSGPDNAAGEDSAGYCVVKSPDPRAERVSRFIRHFMASASDDEKVWFEMQLKLHVPHYVFFLDQHDE